MIGIQALINNLLFILIPLFIYEIFWINKFKEHSKQRKLLQVTIILFTIVLCMSFPVQFETGFTFDLRHIPFILAALYLGITATITTYIFIIFYSYMLSGDGTFIHFTVMTLILLIVPLLKTTYVKLKRKSRILFSSGISFVSSLLLVLLLNFTGDVSFGNYYIYAIMFVLGQTVSMAMIIYSIGKLYENQKLKERVMHAEKLNIISDLSASISHEIRNPLTVTKGFLQLLYQVDLPSQKKKDYLDLALLELKRAELIITDFLSLTKSEVEKNAPIKVLNEINYVVNIIKPFALINKVEIVTEIDINKDISVEGNFNQFQQSLINLVKNGIEAMQNGGKLEINITLKNNNVVIGITDTGIGMSKEEVSRLGTPYYTTKDKGTGLGTYLIFATIESMNGTIDVKSKKGSGTTFSLNIPIYLETTVSS